MRVLLAIIVLVALGALGWSGWWYANASAREDAITRWLAERRAAGWIADAADIRVAGFPYRIETHLTNLELADPAAGWSWRAPAFEFLSLAYQPQHIIAIWPAEQVIATPAGTARVQSTLFRGSVVFDANTRLSLNRTSIEVSGMTIGIDGGGDFYIGKALLATRQATVKGTTSGAAHDISFTAADVRLPEAWLARTDRTGVLPTAIEATTFDLTLVFDRPWDRAAVEGENPLLEQLLIKDMRFNWGPLDLRGSGTLRVDAEGFAEGEIALRARNWREMLDLAESSGAIGGGASGALRTGLELVARLSADPEVLELPLGFSDGRTRLGPLRLGPAPVLSARTQRQ